MRATIVIPSWNTADLTAACLESVIPTLGPDDEVVVIDNGSSDGSASMLCQDFPEVRTICNATNWGYAAANNQGAAAGAGEIVIFLNSDTVVAPGWLDALCAPFADPTIGAVGPLGTNVSGIQAHTDPPWETQDVGRLVGFCLAVRRSALDEIGGWDETFTGGFEDDWLCHQLAARGWRLIVTAATTVEHVGHASFNANDVDWYTRQESNRVPFVNKRRSDIAVVAIVRDEAKVIERMLISAAQVCGRAVIVDTGSTDGTPELVEKACADLGLALTLERRPWVDFAHNRTEALTIAQDSGAGWLLLLDAEQTIDTGALPPLFGDALMLPMSVGGLAYSNVKLVRARRGWKYVGAAHEYLATADDGPHTHSPLPTLRVIDHLDSGDRPSKIERNRVLLESDLERDPDNPRTVFYLAESLRDVGRPADAAPLYRRRAMMTGTWEEEGWYAHWQWGRAVADVDGVGAASPLFLAAYERRPTRAEPLWDLGSRYNRDGRFHSAYMILSHARHIGQPDDVLFVHTPVYHHLCDFEASIAAWWTGRRDEARTLMMSLLARPGLPDNIRDAVTRNLAF